MNRWDHLPKEQQEAASAAARLVEDAGMRFVFMLFGRDGKGAVISNIDPGDAARLIGEAHMAAKSNVDCDTIGDGRERLQ